MFVTAISEMGHKITYKGWCILKEKPAFCRMYYVESGECHYFDDEKKLQLMPGNIYILPTNKTYSVLENPNNKLHHYYIHITLNFQIKDVIEIPLKENSFSADIFNLIKKYIDADNINHVSSLTDLFIQHCLEKNTITINATKIKRYIDENITEKLTAKEVADHFSYSEVHISRMFKNSFNLTITKYIHETKLNYAIRQLNEGHSVTEVSDKLNYSSPANFSRLFKSRFGLSPQMHIANKKQYENTVDEEE